MTFDKMTSYKTFKFGKIHPLLLLGIFIAIILGLFWIAKGIFKLLSFIAPVILIAALVINYRVVLGYLRWLGESFQRNPIFGVVAIALSFLAFPLVAVFLLFRAMSSKGIGMDQIKNQRFDQYEEVEDDDFMDLSDVKEKKQKLDNDYNDVFTS